MLEGFSKTLGKPYFETENCQIYNLDCVLAMKKMDPGSVDLCVTSPPYNIGKEYESIQPVKEYIGWSKEWIEALHRTVKDNGTFWLNLGYISLPDKAKAVPISYLLWDSVPFFLIQEIVWHYGAGVAGRLFFSPRNEKFLWYVKDPSTYTFNLDDIRDKNVKYPNQKKNGKIRVNPLGKNPGDVWIIPKVTAGKNRSSKERTAHPAQFPMAVIDRIIKASSKPGEVILDPFMGSGTTAIAALENGRKVIGFEISDRYCEIAKNRILGYLKTKKQDSLL